MGIMAMMAAAAPQPAVLAMSAPPAVTAPAAAPASAPVTETPINGGPAEPAAAADASSSRRPSPQILIPADLTGGMCPRSATASAHGSASSRLNVNDGGGPVAGHERKASSVSVAPNGSNPFTFKTSTVSVNVPQDSSIQQRRQSSAVVAVEPPSPAETGEQRQSHQPPPQLHRNGSTVSTAAENSSSNNVGSYDHGEKTYL